MQAPALEARRPDRGRAATHRILAAIALAAAAVEFLEWLLLRRPGTEVATLILLLTAGLFVVAGRLASRGQAGAGAMLSSATILLAVPTIAVLYDQGFVAALLAPIAIILVLPYVRGRALAALCAAGVAVMALAASANAWGLALESGSREAITDAFTTMVWAAIVTALLFLLTWRADRAREAAAGRFERLVGTLPLGICRTDTAGDLIEVNAAYARMFGYADPESMVGVASASLMVDPAAMLGVVEQLRGGGPVTGTLEARRLDDSTFTVRFTSRATPGPDGLPAWYETVTEDITAERLGSEDRDRFAATMEAAELAIVNQTTTGTILGWNGAAQRLYGWSPDVRGRTVYDVSPREEWDTIRASTARVAGGETIGPFEVERVYLGRTVHLSITVVPVRDASGAITGIATIGRDITADIKLREERARLEEQLRDAQRLEATGRLAGGIAHDFNNLLTGIRGYGSELLDELRPGSDAHEAAAQILRSAEQASRLTHQLLAFARRQVLREEVVNLDAVIAEQVPTLRRITGGAVTLVVDPSPIPALVTADRGQLAEVLLHLVVNAREAMPDGGTVRLATRVVATSAGMAPGARAPVDPDATAPNEVLLRVSDTGRGIPDEALPHVFEPFFTTKDVGRGSGMGLAMVHGVVRQSGGRIEVATGAGGTTMTVHLPLATSLPVPAPALEPTDRAVAGVCLLLVDDEPVVRTIARRILARAGYQVLEAADAGQAATIAGADGERIGALVTDVIMPGMRGPELARLLREANPGLPVLFLSGYAGTEDQPDVTQPGTRFLAKPFTAMELLEAVAGILATGQRGTEAPGARPAPR